MAKQHILIIEDEERIRTLITKYLTLEGYQTTSLATVIDAIAKIQSIKPDLILLDIMLPGGDGLSLCQNIRQFSQVPIILLTARTEEIDKLLGFKCGADDYVTKPFSPRELVARVGAILKRSGESPPLNDVYTYREIVVDCLKHHVIVNDQTINLTLNEFNLLKTLISVPEKVFSRKELLLNTKNVDMEIYQRTIDTHIKNIRKKIAALNNGNHYINSVYGVGYQLSVLA